MEKDNMEFIKSDLDNFYHLYHCTAKLNKNHPSTVNAAVYKLLYHIAEGTIKVIEGGPGGWTLEYYYRDELAAKWNGVEWEEV